MRDILINIDEKMNKQVVLVQDTKIVESYIQKDEKQENNIYIGKVHDVLEGMGAAFIDIGQEKKVYLTMSEMLSNIYGVHDIQKDTKGLSIKKYLKKDMPILVQVKKEAVSTKGAKVTTNLSYTGSYIVLLPYSNFITISKKIENVEVKKYLKELVKKNIPDGYGAIIRTSANGKNDEDIIKDINIQLKKIEFVNKRFEEVKQENLSFPLCVDKNNDISKKMVIDNINNNIDRIIINEKSEYEKIRELISSIDDKSKLNIILKQEDIFNMYSIHLQKEKLEKRKIWIKCGGFITIDKTEALIAIDVNSAKFTGKKSFNETVFKVNKEATIEIAKQIRLRDLGGIIIVDYINMDSEEQQNEIIQIFNECLKQDRAKSKIIGFTKLKLLELTRKSIYS